MTFPKTLITEETGPPVPPGPDAAPDESPDADAEASAVALMIVRPANELPKSVVSEIVRAEAGLTATKVRAVDPSNNALNLFIKLKSDIDMV